MDVYQFKGIMYKYLQEINAEKPVLEYCLFEPGVFTNYLAYPYQSTKHLFITPVFMALDEKQVIQTDDGEEWQTFTTIDDVARVVGRAIDYPGKWPEIGGIVGHKIQTKDAIKLAEKVLGMCSIMNSVNIFSLFGC